LSDDGVFKSRFFPGLWIDGSAIASRDLEGILRTGHRGLRSKEHAAFVKKMKAAMPKPGRRRKK
jgi:hypothetical protein